MGTTTSKSASPDASSSRGTALRALGTGALGAANAVAASQSVPKQGGAEEGLVIGGLEQAVNYRGGIVELSNKQMLKNIYSRAGELLKMNLDPRGKTPKELADTLTKTMPNPQPGKGNGKIFSSREANQLKACEMIAKAINEEMGQTLINIREKPGTICDDAIEVINSLGTGLHTEFVKVKEDVRRIIKNIKVVSGLLDKNWRALEERIATSALKEDSMVAADTALIRQAHRDVNLELKRQIGLLEGIMGSVVQPADIELEKALKEIKDFRGLVRKIKQYPGSSKFGEKISYVLTGMASLAQAVRIVDNALTKLGVKYDEYASTKSTGELKKLLSKALRSNLFKDDYELTKLFRAANTLVNQEYHKPEILEVMAEKKKKKGSKEKAKGGNSEETPMEVTAEGGENESSPQPIVGGAKLDKRVKRRQDVKRMVLKTFAQQLGVIFDSILVAAEHIGKGVGAARIPLTDLLEKFPKALEVLPDIQKTNVYLSLSGFYNDITAREERERFISASRYIISVLDDIIKKPEYAKEEHFRDMKKGFEEINRLIEDFSRKFLEGFGALPLKKPRPADTRTLALIGADEKKREHSGNEAPSTEEEKEEMEEEMEEEEEETEEEIEEEKKVEGGGKRKRKRGGLDCDIRTLNVPEITRLTYQFQRLMNIIRYYFRTAKIRVNLAKSSVEMKEAGEDYVKILADAVANSVDKVMIELKEFVRASENECSSLFRAVVTITKEEAARNPTQAREREAQIARLRQIVEVRRKMFNARINMYRVAEAVDLYMKAFADGIASHPDDLRDILRILNSTEVISKWYTEKSGDMLCHVFDTFPYAFRGNGPYYNALNENNNLRTLTEHYYTHVAALCKLGSMQAMNAVLPEIFTNPNQSWDDWARAAGAKKTSESFNSNLPTPPPHVPGGIRIVFTSPVNNMPSLPGNPFLALPAVAGSYDSNDHDAKKAISWAEKALGVTVLKNIVSAFVSVGSHFGGQELMRKAPMSAIMLYKNLSDYIVQSAFAMGARGTAPGDCPFGPEEWARASEGFARDSSTSATDAKLRADEAQLNAQAAAAATAPHPVGDNSEPSMTALTVPKFNDSRDLHWAYPVHQDLTATGGESTYRGARIRVGFTAEKEFGSNTPAERERANLRRLTYVGMRGAGAFHTDSPFSREFDETDELFVLVIKSIVAKILTSIGVYNMFNRPINPDGLGYFSGLRFVLGGSLETPKIIPEALELYIRLPLLAEFYRDVLNFEEGVVNEKALTTISMVPEMDGVFSGLIAIIFDRARYVESGNYSDTDIRAMVEEVNKIWVRFKDSKNVVSDVIQEFIAEVNRRIGIYERSERECYLEERRRRYAERYGELQPEELTDYSLSAIDEEDTGFRPTPSMSYQTEGGIAVPMTHKYKLDLENHRRFINELRDKIHNMFQKAEKHLNADKDLEAVTKRITLSNLILSRKEELKHARTDQESYNIVQNAVSSLSAFSMPALERSLILFHELVMAPLATLHLLYKFLSQFQSTLNTIYTALKNFQEWFYKGQNFDDLTSAAGVMNQPWARRFTVSNATDVLVRKGYNGLEARYPGWNGSTATPFPGLALGSYNAVVNNAAFAALEGLTLQHLELIVKRNSNLPRKELADLLMRFVPLQDIFFTYTLELLYTHGTTLDGLIDSRLNVARGEDGETCLITVLLDHSKLRKYVSDTLNGVKQSVDKFRGLLPKTTIEKFERNKDPGSLYYLEKHLVDELLDGKWSEAPPTPLKYNDNLDLAGEKLTEIFAYLTKKWDFNARGLLSLGIYYQNLGAAIAPDTTFTLTGLDWHKVIPLRKMGLHFPASWDQFSEKEKKQGSHHEFVEEIYSLLFYTPFQINTLFKAGVGRVKSQFNLSKYNPAIHTGILKVLFNTSGRIKEGTDKDKPYPGLINLGHPAEPTGATTPNPIPGGDPVPVCSAKPVNNLGIADPISCQPSMFRYIYSPDQGFRFDKARSVFFSFNRLVAAYIVQAFDQATGRIYLSTINEFANGAFSSAVLGNNFYVDSTIWSTNTPVSEGPIINEPGARCMGVLTMTLALILRRLLNEKTHTGDKKQYLETELSEVPLYMKERIKASFPIFNKMFFYLMKRCELLKHMVEALNIAQVANGKAIPDCEAQVRVSKDGSAWRTNAPYIKSKSNEDNKRDMNKLLDQVITGCSSLMHCIKTTLSELSDDPKYLETRQGFIQEYESMNGMYPFMPQSSLLYYLKGFDLYPGTRDETADIALPIFKLGDTKFKLQYGTRAILNKPEVKLSDLPGMLHLIKEHNLSTEEKYHFDDKSLDRFTDANISLARYLIDAQRYRGMLTWIITGDKHTRLIVNADRQHIASHALAQLTHTDRSHSEHKMMPYSLRPGVTLTDVIRMTENNFQREERRKIVTLVEDKDPCVEFSRRDMVVFNIIDLNVVPINIHVLRREIPLIHLYNYSWTFDCFVEELLGVNGLRGKGLYTPVNLAPAPQDHGGRRGLNLLGHLTVAPYAELSLGEYTFDLAKVLRGGIGLEGLSRPKYLTDEVFSKALFGELYVSRFFKEEGGPGFGDAKLRGIHTSFTESLKMGDSFRNLAKGIFLDVVIFLASSGYVPNPLGLGYRALTVNVIWAPTIDSLFNDLWEKMYDSNTGLLKNDIDLLEIAKASYDEAKKMLQQTPGGQVALQGIGMTPDASAEALTKLGMITLLYILHPNVKNVIITLMSRLFGSNPGEELDFPTGNSPADLTKKDQIYGELTSKWKSEGEGSQTNAQARYRNLTNPIARIIEIICKSYFPPGRGAHQVTLPGGNVLSITKESAFDLTDINDTISAIRLNGSLSNITLEVLIKLAEATVDIAERLGKFDLTGNAPLPFIASINNEPLFSTNEEVILGRKNFLEAAILASKNYPQDTPYPVLSQKERMNPNYFDGKLHYLKYDGKEKETKLKPVDVGTHHGVLHAIGKLRFDTIFVRNLFWLTNIQRLLRLKLRRDLTWFDQKVVSEHAVTASGITELYGDDTQTTRYPEEYRY